MTMALAADQAVRTEPRRVSAALVVATLVTLAAAIPLGLVAWSARNDQPAPSDGLVATSASGVEMLAGLTLTPGVVADLRVIEPEFVAVAWTLFADDVEVASNEVIGESPFVLELAESTIGSLDVGSYDLLVTGTERDGTVVHRAAAFAIGDAP